MKRYAIALSTCTLLAAVGTATAYEPKSTECTIRWIHPQGSSLVCESGKQFRLGEGLSLKDLRAGMKVLVTYQNISGDSEDEGGGLIATEIKPAPAKG